MDRNYFHYFSENDANPGSHAAHPGAFSQQRSTQFWYLNPVNNIYQDDYLFLKTFMTCIPGILLYYYAYIKPRSNKKKYGRTNDFVKCVKM